MTCPSSCHDPNCRLSYREHLLSIGVAAAALPSRKKALIGFEAKERMWDKEHAAYRRLRKDGLQPPKREGSALLEAEAECAEQVNTGMLNVKARAFEVFREETGCRATEPQVSARAAE